MTLDYENWASNRIQTLINENYQLRQRVQELEKENSIERNLRIGVEAGFDFANEELGRLKARIENLMLDSEQWRTDCQSYCDAMHRREAAITSLQAERDNLLADVERCYRMLLSEPDTKGALFKAENILREAIDSTKESK